MKCVIAYLGNTRQRNALLYEAVRSITKLLDLLIRERVNPFLGVVLVVLLPPYSLARNLLGERRVRLQLIVDRRVLARCPDAVWEDIPRGIVVLTPKSSSMCSLVNDCAWCHI